VTFDIFLQGFEQGEGAVGDAAAARLALAPYLVEQTLDDEHGFALLRAPDGCEADVYGLGGAGIMVNHTNGGQVYDVLLQVAAAGRWAIIPAGCPTCVPFPEMLADLPDELQDEAIVVRSGEEIRRAIEDAWLR
jgi:hypothetical protein